MSTLGTPPFGWPLINLKGQHTQRYAPQVSS